MKFVSIYGIISFILFLGVGLTVNVMIAIYGPTMMVPLWLSLVFVTIVINLFVSLLVFMITFTKLLINSDGIK